MRMPSRTWEVLALTGVNLLLGGAFHRCRGSPTAIIRDRLCCNGAHDAPRDAVPRPPRWPSGPPRRLKIWRAQAGGGTLGGESSAGEISCSCAGWDMPSPFVACHASPKNSRLKEDKKKKDVLPPCPKRRN